MPITTNSINTLVPNSRILLFDDFISVINLSGQFGWFRVNFFPCFTTGTSTNPGLLSAQPDISNDAQISMGQSIIDGDFQLGASTLDNNFVHDLVALSDDTNSYEVFCGVSAGTTLFTGPLTDGIYFHYTHTVNSGNWQIICVNSGVATTINTGISATTGFHNYGISANASGTQIRFYIDHIQIPGTPITTNIPTTAMTPFFWVKYLSGTIVPQNLDLWYLEQTLNTKR